MSCKRWQGMMKFWIVRYLVSLRQPENPELFEPCGEMIIHENLTAKNPKTGGIVEKIIVTRCNLCGKIEKNVVFD